ncbi:caspase-10 [Lissotriton helveticus]
MDESKDMMFRSVLLDIDRHLGKEDVDGIKFLCSDILPSKKLHNVTSADKIFQLLIEQDLINKDDLFLVAELLYKIRQWSLLRKLNFTKESVRAALPSRATVSRYRQLLYDISEDIGTEDHNEIMFLLQDTLPKKHRETLSTLHLLTLMEAQALISPENLEFLETICKNISPEIVNKITKYKAEQVRLPSQETSPVLEAPKSQEESAVKPHLGYHSTPESFPCQTENSSAAQSTLICRDTTGSVSHSLAELDLGQGSESCSADGNSEGLPVYKMGEQCRGYCLIISNNKFSKNIERKGTAKDAEALKRVFTWLGLEVHCHTDLSAAGMKECMQTFKTKIHDNMDCFVCCILSHGESGNVYGTDDTLLPIRTLTAYFTPKECPSLTEKPKLFFIQACQGKDTQPRVLLEADASSSKTERVLHKSIPEYADFLLGMATVDGFSSFRHVIAGTWYIQSLCRNLVALVPRHEDILSILLKVNDEVSAQADRSGMMKQMPQPAFTLRKKLIFPVPNEPPPHLD